MDPLRLGRQWIRAAACLGLVLAIGLAGCGGGTRSSVCVGYDTLRAAVRAVEAAQAANGDDAEVRRQMDEVDRLLRVARSNLSGVDPNSSAGAAARGLLEAANYLEFMVGDYRSAGVVDFALTQFASRELNGAVSGGGGAPMNC